MSKNAYFTIYNPPFQKKTIPSLHRNRHLVLGILESSTPPSAHVHLTQPNSHQHLPTPLSSSSSRFSPPSSSAPKTP